jgi:hypothetical protein
MLEESRRMGIAREIIAQRLLKQGEWCERLGSRLYTKLLRNAAADVLAEGVCWEVLQGHHDDPPGSALALRFLGAVHRLVLEGKARRLAACYPSAGGDADCDDLWPGFRAAVQEHCAGIACPCPLPRTANEAGRCAALLGGFLEIARRTGLPLRLLEIGASAGLILRWDQYRYEEHDGWGDPGSPVRFCGAFGELHPGFDVQAQVMERLGCDAQPVDAGTDEGKLTLESYVWPDQVERFRQLAAAIDIARRVPARVEKANAADWIEAAVAVRVAGAATVVYHSIVWQYLSPEDRSRVENAISSAGEASSAENPLAWLRFEPGRDAAEVRLRLWPGGEDQLLARAGFHGRPVSWQTGINS